ncbi:MAG: Oxidoreductase, zinc-binding dehydrogenase family [Bryobacterales bacterium]|nr:Oxidoreductase, zinc-binding dehydrogenase family [Bryobacterales bacterium]
MKAAWYEKQGPARDVLMVGEMPDPHPGPGEVRICVAASGVNPGDVKKRQNAFDYGMPFSRVIPHSDGAGRIDEVGDGVSSDWIGQMVWCYGAQSYRPFGTAAEFTIVPVDQVAHLPGGVSAEQGACLGIPGITAHRAVHIAGPVKGRIVLVQGASGAVGLCAVQLAVRAGARVIGAVRSTSGEDLARHAGADEVIHHGPEFAAQVRALAPDGIDHIIEVAFDANIDVDVQLLKMGGSIATYAAGYGVSKIPFWQLVFQNTRLFFLGSDDFPNEAKMAAAQDLNAALETGWAGFEIRECLPLEQIVRAHELVEEGCGRVVVSVK